MYLTRVFKKSDNYESTLTGHDYSYVFCESKQDSLNFGKNKNYKNAISINLYDQKYIGFTIKSPKIVFKFGELPVIRVNDSLNKIRKLFNQEDYRLKEKEKNEKEI